MARAGPCLPDGAGPNQVRPTRAGPPETATAYPSAVRAEVGEEPVGGRVRVEAAVGHGRGERRQGGTLAERSDPGTQRGQYDRLDLGGGPRLPPAAQLVVRLQPRPVLVHGGEDVLDPFALRRDRAYDDRAPLARAALAERDHALDVAVRRVGAVPVPLVDHEDVADLEDVGLHRLDRVTHARAQYHDLRIRERGHLDLGLADPDGLDEYHVAAGALQDAYRLGRGGGEAAELATRGHRA